MSQKKIKTIKNVEFYYTSVSFPSKQRNDENKKPLSDDPLEFHSYEVKILLNKERWRQFKEAFKGAKNLPYVKEYTPKEYVEKLNNGRVGIEEPEDDMYLVKFAQSCLSGPANNRRPSYPIKQIGVRGKIQDRLGNEIDQKTAIGNGTKGHLQFKPVVTKFGTYLYPVALCITELVPWTGSAGYDEDAFGLEEVSEEDKKLAEQKREEQAALEQKGEEDLGEDFSEQESEGNETDDWEDDIPF